MDRRDALKAWGKILLGRKPLLSIEITKECPLHCPGCYAYDDQHLGGESVLRQLTDSKGDELVRRVLDVVDRLKPLHLSIVGGDPLVRYREVSALLPQLASRGIYVQVVTSAFREIPLGWRELPSLKVVVSIDGLQAEHDARRKPATYDRILKNIAGHEVTVHCTVTSKMLDNPKFFDEFLDFWSAKPEVTQIWMSIFTPQIGSDDVETPSPEQRQRIVEELLRVRSAYPKLDMREEMIRHFLNPPQSPESCVFAKSTETITADLKTRIEPCQFGGNPDCSRCGCAASMGLNEVASRRVGGISVGKIFQVSHSIGQTVSTVRVTRL